MEMVEKVARAIIPHPSDYEEFIDRAQEDPEGTFLVLARAAIEAMREPTDAMLIDGAAKIRNFTWTTGPYPRTRAVWISMIDASLTNNPVLPDSSPGPQVNPEEQKQ